MQRKVWLQFRESQQRSINISSGFFKCDCPITALVRFPTLNMWSLSSLLYQLMITWWDEWEGPPWAMPHQLTLVFSLTPGLQARWEHPGWFVRIRQRGPEEQREIHRWMDASMRAWSIARWMGEGGGEGRVLMAACGPGCITTESGRQLPVRVANRSSLPKCSQRSLFTAKWLGLCSCPSCLLIKYEKQGTGQGECFMSVD